MQIYRHELTYKYYTSCHIRDITYIEGVDSKGKKFFSSDMLKIGSNNHLAEKYVEVSEWSTIHRETLTEVMFGEEKLSEIFNHNIIFGVMKELQWL